MNGSAKSEANFFINPEEKLQMMSVAKGLELVFESGLNPKNEKALK